MSIRGSTFGWFRGVVPIMVAAGLALLPAPPGLALHAWYYFALFAGVVVALVLEPLPGGAVGLIGVVLVCLLAPWVFYGPADLAKPGFRPEQGVLGWALSGFSNSTVWLIFSAFMFALGYDRTGLGRRLALVLVRRMGGRTLTLGYAIALADLVLAPFTPSNTARSGGTIYPVIRNLPALYGSKSFDPSARRLGSYLMWVAIASTCVTSSLFMTGLATNLLALELIRKTTGVTLAWGDWFLAFLPAGVVLLTLVPLLTWWLYPPEVKSGGEVQRWAQGELAAMGRIGAREVLLALIVGTALALWIFGGSVVHATTVALAAIATMLVTRILTWEDVLAHKQAWNTLAWFATLVALADGLSRVGFVTWFAQSAGGALADVPAGLAGVGLIAVFYFAHYFFASSTAHATALLPVMLIVGQAIPGIEVGTFALQLALTLGLMGILTPYATGPSPIYYGSGYIASRDYWRLGAIFGIVYFVGYLGLTLPWMAWLNR